MNIIEYEKYRNNKAKSESYDFITNVINHMPDYIKKESEFLTLRKNSILISMGDFHHSVYIVVKGEVTVVNELESGKSFEPVVIGHSDFIGIVEMINNIKNVISTNVTSSYFEYIRVPLPLFLKWLEESHEITRLVLNSVCMNFQKNMMESGESVLLSSMYLLVSHLLNRAIYNDFDSLYRIHETREKTSKRTGINVRTLYRHIKKLRQDGYINVVGRDIVYSENQKAMLYQFYIQLRNK